MRASDKKPDPHGACECGQCKDMLDYVLRAQKAALEEEAKQWLNEIAYGSAVGYPPVPHPVKGEVYYYKSIRYVYDGYVWTVTK